MCTHVQRFRVHSLHWLCIVVDALARLGFTLSVFDKMTAQKVLRAD